MFKKLIKVMIISLLLITSGCSNNDINDIKDIKPTEQSDKQASLEVHYIDVGQADATLIKCNDEYMLIDGGNVEDSNLIYTYLEDRSITKLKYIVCTHAHEDHVGGLSGALEYADIDTAFSPTNYYDTKAFKEFKRHVNEKGKELVIPSAGDYFMLGDAKCEILSSNAYPDNTNNTSIVIKMTYKDVSFLFSGDAEWEVERDIINNGFDIKADVMKAGHHGSSTSSSYRWLNEAMSKYAIISCAKANEYGHPHDEVLKKFKDANIKVYRTDMQGDIVCYSDGYDIWFEVSRNKDIDTYDMTDYKETTFIINNNTKVFHDPKCQSAIDMKESNKKETSLSKQELIKEGYKPCGKCNP